MTAPLFWLAVAEAEVGQAEGADPVDPPGVEAPVKVGKKER